MDINVGEVVFFIENGQIHYRRIVRIVTTEDGSFAVFSDGCHRDQLSVPIEQVFTTREELKKYLEKKENKNEL